ncbi:MAGE-domain-containing protein [Fomitiporia mediterranea MF3/22]|uniref:MAGE-domain-containing protein n=1 Tax=Fomitiporia mediterranea (strain MF3/22) TaxID=694068 RepID=UPI0004407D8B|nr:MAGE-domain-containing protein [Fomitiporia mediterranea MF3/22]EJD00539.1 MAGE-domain-containing protein [Fomitiporia mediterranea MF3/22]
MASQYRRRRDEEEDEDEEMVLDEDADEDEEGGSAVDDMTRKANALVRLALFNESRHVPLRRDEINKRILGENTRAFNIVFAMAQETLQSTFGMELVELMSRAERDREQNENDEVQDGANATGLKKKAASSGSKSYILRSCLPEELIRIAAESNEELLTLEFDNDNTEADDEDDLPTTYGSIINWTSADQLGGLGLLYVILALILVNGHSMSDPELKKHLKTFRLPMSATIEFVPHATHRSMSIESYLSLLIKQGHLDRVKMGPGGAPKPTQGKRGRTAAHADHDEEGATYEWRWGARAHAEVGERAVAEFVAEFMAERIIRDVETGQAPRTSTRRRRNEGEEDDDEEGEEGEERRMADEEREKILAAMMKDITRAAGGRLTEAR